MTMDRLRLGRTDVRIERDVRGSMRRNVGHLSQDRSRTRDGRGRQSRPGSYHSATSAQNQDRGHHLQFTQDLRGPPPPRSCAPAAMEEPGGPCTSGPVRPPMSAMGVMGCQSKAPQVQSRCRHFCVLSFPRRSFRFKVFLGRCVH